MIFTATLPFDTRQLRPNLTLPQFFLDNTHPERPHRSGGKPWLIDSTTGRSYDLEEIRERVFGLANALSALYRIKENDVVSIHSLNDIDYIVVLFAIHRLGAVAVCSNPGWTVPELEHQYRQSRPGFIFTQAPFVETARNAAAALNLGLHDRIVIIEPPKDGYHPASSSAQHSLRPLNTNASVAPTVDYLIQRGLGDLNVDGPKFTERTLKEKEAMEKIALYLSSSGTSGAPKLVALSHYNLTAAMLQTSAAYRANDPSIPWKDRRIRDGDVVSCILPMFHVSGLVIAALANMWIGVPIVIFRRYIFNDVLAGIARFQISHLFIVPPIAIDLVKRPEAHLQKADLSSLRFVLSGAAPLKATLELALRKKLPNADIGQGYGLTETTSLIMMWPHSARYNSTVGSAGQLYPGWEAKIVKITPEESTSESNQEILLGYDEPGELYLRGPSVALRYEGNEKSTRETFLPDNWVRTGDQAYINKKGDVFIVDRLKEFMKVKGDQVAPAELEGRLLGHPDVLDACVVGVPDERSGELPFAFIALQPAARRRLKVSPNEAAKIKRSVAKWVESHEAKYKWLAGGVGFIDQIPKNASGKILRRLLRGEAAKLKQSADEALENSLQASAKL